MSSSGGTITNTTCSASADSSRGPSKRREAQLNPATTIARLTASAKVRMMKSPPAYVVRRISAKATVPQIAVSATSEA